MDGMDEIKLIDAAKRMIKQIVVDNEDRSIDPRDEDFMGPRDFTEWLERRFVPRAALMAEVALTDTDAAYYVDRFRREMPDLIDEVVLSR